MFSIFCYECKESMDLDDISFDVHMLADIYDERRVYQSVVVRCPYCNNKQEVSERTWIT